MKFSYRWLCDLVPGLSNEPAELQRLITMKTAECEGIEPVGAHFAKVVAARVISVNPIPKGKNKSVVIDTGDGREISVVCGAGNVRPGLLVPWVPPGTTLGEKTIGRAVIEGVESDGMLASAAELGINRDHSGLLELANMEPGQHLSGLLPDWIIEIDNKSLTHRPDLWGHYGMAREVAAITARPLRDPVSGAKGTDARLHTGKGLAISSGGALNTETVLREFAGSELLPRGAPAIAVEIADPALCPRYSALALEAVEVKPSPLWLQARLEHIGLNPINNIVDITNYILAELPQPMHAFDADKLAGGTIFVRPARSGEKLAALNGETYTLNTADLVIADASGPIALAGVIGGADTAISESTERVILESANFQASSVRLSSSRHKLRTDASMRFEKSLDPENTLRGLARAVELLSTVCPGIRVTGGVTDNRTPLPNTAPIALPLDFVVRKLGKEVTQQQVAGILQALGFDSLETAPGVLTVTVPTWRATKDISLKDDLVEEIGRMIGYDQISPAPPLLAAVVPPGNPLCQYLRRIRAQLVAQGFTEIYNYSFVNETETKKFQGDIRDTIAVRNPIASELTHLRRSLLPGLFKNIISNVRHFSEFRLFEIGNEVHPNLKSPLPKEVTHLTAALYDAHGDRQDFFEMKRVVECLFPQSRLSAAEARGYEHPARAAEIEWRGSVIGRLFELHPSLLEAEGIEGRAMLFDVDLDATLRLAATRDVKYAPLRKYPASGFDLSVVAGLRIPVARIHDQLTVLAGSNLVALDFIRQYDGPPLPTGQKSVSYHLEVGAVDHTMSTEEVTEIRNRIIHGLQQSGFELRGLDTA